MKTPLILIIPAVVLAAAVAHPRLPGIQATAVLASQNSEQPSDKDRTPPAIGKIVIEPGLSVGPVKLGDTRDHALELFPRKNEDQEWDDPCGTTLDWVDAANPRGRGDLWIRLKRGKVFQIESSTTRFHTAEGIATFDPPEKVATAYKGLLAYTLLTPPAASLGDRPLVFWIDRKKGIAFTFAYDVSRHKRYLYKIVVFAPNRDFCPELERPNSSKWQLIPPYAVEPPAELSPEPY